MHYLKCNVFKSSEPFPREFVVYKSPFMCTNILITEILPWQSNACTFVPGDKPFHLLAIKY